MPLRWQENHVCLAPSGNVQTAVELNFFLATTWICRLANQYEWRERPSLVSPTEKAADHDTGFYNCSVTQSRAAVFLCVCHTTYCGGSSHHRRSLTQPDLKKHSERSSNDNKKKCRLLSPSRLCELCDCLTNVLRLPRRPQTSVDGEAIRAFWRDGVFRNTKSQMLHRLQRGLHQMLPPRDEKEALWVIKACISSFFFFFFFRGCVFRDFYVRKLQSRDEQGKHRKTRQ